MSAVLALFGGIGPRAFPASGKGRGEGRDAIAQYDFPTGGLSMDRAETPQTAFIDLGADVEPVGIANDGTITAWQNYPPYNLVRWNGGVNTVLQKPAFQHDPALSSWLFSPPLFRSSELNRNGWLMVSVMDISRGENLSIDDIFTAYWPAGLTAPLAIHGPSFFFPPPESGFPASQSSVAFPFSLNASNRVWVTTEREGGREERIHTSPEEFSLYFNRPHDSGRDLQVYQTNFTGQAIGWVYTPSDFQGYFLGQPIASHVVSFMPLGLNERGDVVGDISSHTINSDARTSLNADVYSSHLLQSAPGETTIFPFVRLGDGTEIDIPDFFCGITGFDDQANVYGYDGDGEAVIWVAKPVEWGLPVETPAYTAIRWAMPVLPEGFTSRYGIRPGSARIELGVADKRLPDATIESHGFALIPAQLRVDFNRDGVIDVADAPGNPDREFAEKHLPYFFWINDDDDAGETSGDDIPGKLPSIQDGTNFTVDGVRDLVDFFPLYLDIKHLLELLPPAAGFVYKLVHETEAVGFVETDLTPATAGTYLTDVPLARSLASASTIAVTAAGVALSPAWLDQIRTSAKGILLIEGVHPTHLPLRLEVWKGTQRAALLELPLSLSGVESMFRRANLVSAGRISVDSGAESRATAFNYPDELCNDKWFVFVHGYNVNQQQARGWQSEFFKRLWWSGSRAKFVGVTWYGSDSQTRFGFTPNYHGNVVHAFETAGPLADFLATLSPTGSGLNVAAHSLGNMVVSSAISDHNARIQNYFMINAAVASEAYDEAEAQAPNATATMAHSEWTQERGGVYPAKLWATQWHALFPNDDARSRLTWRNRFSNRGSLAFYNFYSKGEEVLANHVGPTPSLSSVLVDEFGHVVWNFLFQADVADGVFAWAYQEKLKGHTLSNKILGSNFGGWGFSRMAFLRIPGKEGPKLAPVELSPPQATELFPNDPSPELKMTPFFNTGSAQHLLESWPTAANFYGDNLAEIYKPERADVAEHHHNRLLAQMIPALSFAAGSNKLEKLNTGTIEDRNFDMNSIDFRGRDFQWTAERADSNWRHSDLKKVAYPYTKNLFTSFKEIGGLSL